MSLAYQRAATPASGWDAWGSVVFGTTRIALRRLVVFGGVALLLLTLLIRTGEAGIGQLVASILFGVPLLAIGSLTRTVGLRLLGRLLLIGVALVGVMYLLALIAITPLMEFSRPRVFVVPALEQLLVMAPLVALLWRSGRTWSLGATDLLLAGVAVGIGFALVEESYIRHAGGDTYLAWLPVVAEDAGRIVGGHPLWAGLGGATLGLGLLLRSRGPMWLVVAASGSVLAFVDHAAHNNHVGWGDELAGLLNLVTLSGWLPVVAFLALVAACIGADLAVQRRLEPLPHWALPPRGPGLAGLLETWNFLSRRRRLAIADFHRRRLPEATRQAAEREARRLDEHLAASQPPDSGAGSVGGASGGGMLLVLSLVGAGLAAIAGLMADAAALVPAAVILAVLDVGSNCDPWCLLSSGGGLGGSADPQDEDEEEEEEDCEAQQAAVDAAEARCTGLEALVDALSGQLAGMVSQAQALMAQLQAMLPGLIGDPVAGGAAADLFGALGTAQQQAAGGAGGGAAAPGFFGTAGPMLHGPISGAQGLFPAALPPSQGLAAGALALLAQLQSVLAAGAALANKLQDAEGDLQRCREDLAEAEEALARCRAAQG